MRERHTRRGKPEALVFAILAAVSVSVVALSQFALPRGLRPAVSLRGSSQAYTHQIAGYVLVPDDGPYRLAIFSNGPSRLAVNDHLAASVGEGGGEARAPDVVSPGVQRLAIHYTPGPPRAYSRPELRWGRAADPAVAIPADSLAPRRLRPLEWELRRWLPAAGIALSVAWAAAAMWLAARRFRWSIEGPEGGPSTARVLTALLALTLALHAYPLWWGLPVFWGQDELEPLDILLGLRERFAHGWHTKYPPLHMYLLTLVYLPALGFVELGLLESNDPSLSPTLALIGRALTVVMSMGTTALVYTCGRLLVAPRAAALGALVWTLVLPLTYYAKLANLDVPYTFWFALSLVGYVRAVMRGLVRDFVLFGAAAAAAVASKDQAYGLYLLPALHLAWTRLRHHGGSRALSGVARTLVDRALLAGIATGVLVFAAAHNLAFNWTGFQEHVKLITGGASQNYRMVDSWSAGGQVWLLARTVEQTAWSMSVPGALVACAGLLLALRRRTDEARRLLLLLLPAISYYLTFIAVVGYVYDRFLLPVCLVFALFAGFAIDHAWRLPAPRWKTAAVTGLFVYMAWRTASIDLLMAADRRYAAEEWMRAHVAAGSSVGVLEWHQMLPALDGYRVVALGGPPAQPDAPRPETLVITGGYPKRYVPGGLEAQWYDAAIRGAQGYRVALRLEEQPLLAILARERPFREMDTRFTILPKVSPEVYVLIREPESVGAKRR